MARAGPSTRPAAFANAILGTGLSDDHWIMPFNPHTSGNLSSMGVACRIAGGDPDHFVYGDKLVQENFSCLIHGMQVNAALSVLGVAITGPEMMRSRNILTCRRRQAPKWLWSPPRTSCANSSATTSTFPSAMCASRPKMPTGARWRRTGLKTGWISAASRCLTCNSKSCRCSYPTKTLGFSNRTTATGRLYPLPGEHVQHKCAVELDAFVKTLRSQEPSTPSFADGRRGLCIWPMHPASRTRTTLRVRACCLGSGNLL